MGTVPFMTLAQLQECNNDGHTVGNHTAAHKNYNTSTLADWKADVLEGKLWTEANFNNQPVYAHTSGQYDDVANEYLRSLGYVVGRGSRSTQGEPMTGAGHSCLFTPAQFPNAFEHRVIDLSVANQLYSTAALVNAAIDAALERKQHVHIYWHILTVGATLAGHYEPAQFDLVMAHIASKVPASAYAETYHDFAREEYGFGGSHNILSMSRRTLNGPPKKRIYPKTRRGSLRDM